MYEFTKEDVAAFYRKKSAFRTDLLAQDWKDDKAIRMSGGQIPFLSSDKVKRTIAPLFAKHGLEFIPNYSNLESRDGVQGNQNHVSLMFTGTLVDIDTGYSASSTVYGEAADSQDKAVGKALTYAFKYWVMAEFQISDGIDPDMLSTMSSNTTGFYKKSAEEQEEVKSKVLEQGIKPSKPAEVKPEPKEAPKKESAKKKEPDHENVPANAPVEAPAKEAPKEEPKKAEPENKGFVLTGPQEKTIDRIVRTWTDRAKNGEVTPESYNAMSADRATIGSAQDAIAFIRKYRVGA